MSERIPTEDVEALLIALERQVGRSLSLDALIKELESAKSRFDAAIPNKGKPVMGIHSPVGKWELGWGDAIRLFQIEKDNPKINIPEFISTSIDNGLKNTNTWVVGAQFVGETGMNWNSVKEHTSWITKNFVVENKSFAGLFNPLSSSSVKPSFLQSLHLAYLA